MLVSLQIKFTGESLVTQQIKFTRKINRFENQQHLLGILDEAYWRVNGHLAQCNRLGSIDMHAVSAMNT